MNSNTRSMRAMFPLFIVLFIDGMGLGLLFPILNSIIIDPTIHFLAENTSVRTRDVLYGLIIGIFMISWFFGAAILGDLSDTIGRKKSLLICLFGSFLGYLISAVGILVQSISLLIIGRVIAGFTAGSQPVAQAAIVDASTEENKTRNIGLILLAISLGFVFGPIFGGLLSNNHLVSWFNYSTPLYFAAGISLLNAFLLWYLFEETFHRTEKIRIRLHHAINIFISAFRHEKVRWLSVILLVFIFGWSNYFSFMSMYLLTNFHLDIVGTSLFMACLGVGFSIGFGILVDFCSKRFSYMSTIIVCLFASSLFCFITVAFKLQIIAWLFAIPIGITIAIAYSIIITLFSNQVGPEEQGWVMGITGSIMALCFGLTTFFTGFVAEHSTRLPILMAAIGLLISGILAKLNKKRYS